MSIEFQDEKFSSNQFNQVGSSSGSKMVDFLIKNGVVKDAASANIILIVGSLVFIAISIYIFVYGFNLPQSNTPAPSNRALPSELDQDQPLENNY